jgi:hypothetical protein
VALLTRQDASGPAGATISLANSSASDTLVGGQCIHLWVNNTDAASTVVTLVTPETVEGVLAVADRTVTVPASTLREIPVPSRYNDPATGLATVLFSVNGATVKVAAVAGSPTP